MSPPTHDVIIVGARPAGAATAMLLAPSGLDVLVVDQATRGADTLSLGLLQLGAVVQLDRSGLLPRLEAALTPKVRHALLEVEGRRERSLLSEPLLAPRRTVLDPILVGAARRAGATVRYGITVYAVESGDDGRIHGMSGRRANGRQFRAKGRLVIGADGMRSRVARLVGAPVLRRGQSSSAVVYRHLADGYPAGGYRWVYRQRTSAGLIATDRGRACVWIGTPAARSYRGAGLADADWFDRILEQIAPELAALVRSRSVGPLHVFEGATSVMRRPCGRGWALVGDAGSFTDRASGHGLAGALRDAEFIADAVVATLRDGCDYRTSLIGYQRVRDRPTMPILEATIAIATYDWDATQIGHHLTSLDAALTAEATHLRAREPRPVRLPSASRQSSAENRMLTAACSTTELATIVIEAENGARYVEIATTHGEGQARGAARRYRRRVPEAWQTAAAAGGLLHELIEHGYELLCAIESESN